MSPNRRLSELILRKKLVEATLFSLPLWTWKMRWLCPGHPFPNPHIPRRHRRIDSQLLWPHCKILATPCLFPLSCKCQSTAVQRLCENI